MSRLFNIVLVASLGASCGDYGYYGVEFGAPAYESSGSGWWSPSPGHADRWDYEQYPWYYQPAPAPQRAERQQRAPQAPLPPPPREPAPQADGDADRDPK